MKNSTEQAMQSPSSSPSPKPSPMGDATEGVEATHPELEGNVRQRRLRWQAMYLGLFLLAAWVVALLQPLTRPQWEPPGTWAQEFLHPAETN